MDDLVERIKASIENRDCDPWFPELTNDLVVRAWDCLHSDIGLAPNNYGTARVLRRSISAPRDIIASLKRSSSSDAPTISIEAVQQKWADSYYKAGLSFYSSDEILERTILGCVEEAVAIINQVPSLMGTVDALVRSLHVIKPDDPNHDVSFSEPDIPFSIFVSVPEERVANDAVRVAEAIVHEAMHLQLTLIEQVVPLTASLSKKYYSPWRRESRNAQGIIHALYVFTVINRFLAQVSVSIFHGELAAHVRKRRGEISVQIADTESFEASPELTLLGAKFVQRLIHSSSSSLRSSRIFRTLPNSSSTSRTESLSPDS